MRFPVSYSQEYNRVREQLSQGERLLLGVVKDEIAANPDPGLKGRFEDRGFIYETQPEDFLIEYRILDHGAVSFDRLIDLRNPDL